MKKGTFLIALFFPLLINAQNDWHNSIVNNKIQRISIYRCEYKFGEAEPEGVLKYDTIYNQQGLPEIVNSMSIMKKKYYYDENNNVIKTTSFSSNQYTKVVTENPITVSKNSYDDKKRLIETSEYRGDGTFLRKYSYKYDDQGYLVEKKSTSNFGERTIAYKYKFDINKRVVESSISENGGSPEVTAYKYDNQGLLIEKTLEPSGMYTKTEFVYNSLGLMTDEVCFQLSNATNVGGKFVGDATLQHKYKFKYDDKGLLIEKITFNTSTKEPELLMKNKYENY